VLITENKNRALIRSKKPLKWPKSTFKVSDAIPLISFGDGMKNKDTVPIKGHASGVTEVLYKRTSTTIENL
jgi:hypothetical protein